MEDGYYLLTGLMEMTMRSLTLQGFFQRWEQVEVDPECEIAHRANAC